MSMAMTRKREFAVAAPTGATWGGLTTHRLPHVHHRTIAQPNRDAALFALHCQAKRKGQTACAVWGATDEQNLAVNAVHTKPPSQHHQGRLLVATDGGYIEGLPWASWAWYASRELHGAGMTGYAGSTHAEVVAVTEALRALDPAQPLELLIDCQPVVQWVRRIVGGCQPRPAPSCRAVVAKLCEALDDRDVIATWVRGHAKCTRNKAVDRMASSRLWAVRAAVEVELDPEILLQPAGSTSMRDARTLTQSLA